AAGHAGAGGARGARRARYARVSRRGGAGAVRSAPGRAARRAGAARSRRLRQRRGDRCRGAGGAGAAPGPGAGPVSFARPFMLAADFAPANRIDVAKQTAIEFVRARTSDRIGLVAFAAQALTQVPITTDYAVLEQALKGLHIGMLEDGTAIGTGIATAASRLRRAPGKSKVIVLLTDGVNNRGTVD